MLIRKKLRTEEDRAKAAAKAREKQRKKLIKTKYGQKPLRHSRRGIYSCAYAMVIFFLLFFMLMFAYLAKGDVNILIGFLALGTLALSVIGIWLGIKGLKERDKNYITCKVGIAANVVFLLTLVLLFVRGLF